MVGCFTLKRKILYITDGFSPYVVGGMQAVARRHLECLHQQGYEVVSISSGPDGGARPATYDLPWENCFIPWPGRALWQSLSPWRYVYDLRRFSAEVVKIIDRIKPDCIYSEGPLLDAYLQRPATGRRPVVFHPHGLEMFQRPRTSAMYWELAKVWPMRSLMRRHARFADVVVSQSEGGPLFRIVHHRLGVEKDRIAFLPNAVPEDYPLAETPRSGRPEGRFLFIGRNEARKGLPLLLDAFAKLRRGNPHVRLDVVGWDGAGLLQESGVLFHGAVRDRKDIQAFYRGADYLVLPSYAEGMPTVILEAFAAGLPVIGSDVGAVADLVRDEETGFLVPAGDLAALERAMDSAVKLTTTVYAGLSGRCLERARGSYAAATVCEQLGRLVKHACSLELRSDSVCR